MGHQKLHSVWCQSKCLDQAVESWRSASTWTLEAGGTDRAGDRAIETTRAPAGSVAECLSQVRTVEERKVT